MMFCTPQFERMIIEELNKKEQPLKLEYGRCYLNGEGKMFGSMKRTKGNDFRARAFPFYSNGLTFSIDGNQSFNNTKTIYSLITLLPEDTMEDKIKAAQDKIKAAKANLEAAERELEDARKPKIRHGDYGTYMGQFRLVCGDERSLNGYNPEGSCTTANIAKNGWSEFVRLGNVFDDLKARQ